MSCVRFAVDDTSFWSLEGHRACVADVQNIDDGKLWRGGCEQHAAEMQNINDIPKQVCRTLIRRAKLWRGGWETVTLRCKETESFQPTRA